MDTRSVTFKGTVNGLTIILKEDESFPSILEQIENKIASAGKFFKGATLDVRYRGRSLTEQEEKEIYSLMVAKSGAKIISFEKEKEAPVKEQAASLPQQSKLNMKKFLFFKDIDEGMTKFYKGTVRSGQLVSFDGNLVVIGDVNPGGEVIAAGNVIVMGTLRGIVHAGSNGNKEAIVAALNLHPTQLRIADVITRPPDEKVSKNVMVPELAFVKGDMVYIERYLPQR